MINSKVMLHKGEIVSIVHHSAMNNTYIGSEY